MRAGYKKMKQRANEEIMGIFHKWGQSSWTTIDQGVCERSSKVMVNFGDRWGHQK
jgi:hypothetical protein